MDFKAIEDERFFTSIMSEFMLYIFYKVIIQRRTQIA